MTRLVFCLLVAAAVVHAGKHDKYEGHQLYRVSGTAAQMVELEHSIDILSATSPVHSASGKLEALVRLSPEETQTWLNNFSQRNMAFEKVADNLADILRDEESNLNHAGAARGRAGKSITFDAYYSHEDINNWLDSLGAQYPNVLKIVDAGLSYEGRTIKYAKISTTDFDDKWKPVIVIDAAAHAREWVTPPVACYIIQQLVVNNADSKLTDGIDWVIIPVVNPDGYEYSRSQDRLWRKTRSRSHPGADRCPGVDINRNFDHYFGTMASSADPCSILYEGPKPFSEPETRIVRDVVLEELPRTELYISLHSWGNMFLYAWGNNGTLPGNGLMINLAGVVMATAINQKSLPGSRQYVVGNAANLLYYTTGTSRDWTRAVGVPLTYTLELPGYHYEFIVPPQYIWQIVTETWAGIAAGATHILNYW